MVDKKKTGELRLFTVLLCLGGVDVCDCVQACMHMQYVGICTCVSGPEALYFPNCSQSGNPPTVSTQALVPGMQFPGI